MKEVVLKFGEHLVSLRTAEELHVIVENNNTNQTNVIVEPTINDDDVTYNFDNDATNLTETSDKQESDDDRAYISSLLDNSKDKDILIPYESENNKSIYQEIEESANEVPIYPSDDFKLTQDDDLIVDDNDTSDSESESFVPSIESHIDTEEQFLNEESKEKVVATAKKEFEEPNYDDDESEPMIQDDEVINSQNENNESDSLVQDDESQNENTNDGPMIQDDESEVSTMNIQNHVDDSKFLQDEDENVDNNDFLNNTTLNDDDEDENE